MGTKIGYFTWDWGKQNTQLTRLKTKIKEKHLKVAETVLHHNPKLNFDKNFFTPLFNYHLFWKSSTEFFE